MKKSESFIIIVSLLSISFFSQAQLKIGDKAPVFNALDENGKLWDASEVIGKEFLVVYFYPAAMTGGCTAQACSYRDYKNEFSQLGVTVIGISGDDPENLQYFRKVNDLNFVLLSDQTGEVAKKFGVTTRNGGVNLKELDGKTVELKRNITTMRWTFIIDKTGKIIYIDNEVKASEDTRNTLTAIKQYLSGK